jgi:methyl-accepting chemotaxis protein
MTKSSMGQQIVSDSAAISWPISPRWNWRLSISSASPSETRAEDVAAKLSRVDQSIQLIAFSNGGEIVMEAIGEVWSAKSVTIPALMADLIEKNAGRNRLFDGASSPHRQAWSSVLAFASSQQQGAEAVKDRARASPCRLPASAAPSACCRLPAGHRAQGPDPAGWSAPCAMLPPAISTSMSPTAARADEIGEMARALDVFKMNALDKIRIEGESEKERERPPGQRQRSDTEKAAADAQLRFAVQSLGSALRNLSQGDLVSTIDTPFHR